MYIVIIGDPMGGFKYFGPFPTAEEAESWMDNSDAKDWWIAEVEQPE